MRRIQILIVTLAGIFYMFVLPALVAIGATGDSIVGILFAAFMLLQLWILIIEFAYLSIATVFNLRRKYFFKLFSMLHRGKDNVMGKAQVVFMSFLSFVFMVYGFGIIYTFISNINKSAFNLESLSLVQGIYFSIVTSSTTGFGDINPKNDLTRLIVTGQIIISMFYLVMLFSSVISYLREKNNS